MKVLDWPFNTLSNKLVVTMQANGQSNNPDTDCVQVDTRDDDSSNLRWITINVNGAILYPLIVMK